MKDARFLALVLLVVMAYALATFQGQQMQSRQLEQDAGRIKDKIPRQSDFSFGL